MRKKHNTIDLKEEDFSFVCPLKTSAMKSIDEGYFCGKCEQKIYDVSAFTKEEYANLKKRNSNLCISFKKVVTVGLALSFSACSTLESVPEKSNCNTEKSISKENKLSPFSALDKNTTIKIRKVEYPVLGGKPMPLHRTHHREESTDTSPKTIQSIQELFEEDQNEKQ